MYYIVNNGTGSNPTTAVARIVSHSRGGVILALGSHRRGVRARERALLFEDENEVRTPRRLRFTMKRPCERSKAS